MIILLSPSKKMDTGRLEQTGVCTQPEFTARSAQLIAELRKLSIEQLMDFMGISRKLAELNRTRFQEWLPPFTPANATAAVFSFSGDVYDGLDAMTLTRRDLRFAQQHLRILSGLYGLLRPLDLIQPYRLEMGSALGVGNANSLYQFWSDSITDALNALPAGPVINLASREYVRAVNPRKLDRPIISPVFKEQKNGRLSVVSFHAKRARGRMARYLIRNRIDDPDGLPGFKEDGYRLDSRLSSPDQPVFTRTVG